MTAIKDLLLTEPLLGVRGWEVSPETNWELLQGLRDTTWATDGEFTKAACKAGAHDGANHPEPAPQGDCSCGLYAAHPFRAAARHHHLEYVFHEKLEASGFPGCHTHPRADRVFGVVEATGHVEVHEYGFRAEFARPVGLLLPGSDPHRSHVIDLCRRYRAYRIDSLLGETLESFVARRGGGLSEGTVEGFLQPVRQAEQESAIVEAEVLEEKLRNSRPLSQRVREALPRPVHWTGVLLYYLACAVVGMLLWLMVLLAWIVPILELIAGFSRI